ncbi:MAG: glycosyltransferase [Bdellovibrionaceae bacterium]|nr:glycosyltransferase [Pseudobdellovibrionaceae bacterium]
MKFSILIPAHNEEFFIQKCLDAVDKARTRSKHEVEVIVCLNRCTDGTEKLAREFGAKIVKEDAKNLSKIRNTAAKVATGDVIVTIDADSQMSENTLTEIERLLLIGKYIGGGTKIKTERVSLGIICSTLVIARYALPWKIPSAGIFWCYKKDFDAIGGFNEKMLSIEDLDFAKRLKEYGKSQGKKYGTLWKSHIITSCRKFDKFGDWYFFKNPKVVRALFQGTDQESTNRFYYEMKR